VKKYYTANAYAYTYNHRRIIRMTELTKAFDEARIMAVVESACDIPNLTQAEAVELSQASHNLAVAVDEIGRLSLTYGSQQIGNLVTAQIEGYEGKVSREVVRLVARMEAEHLARYGQRGANND
jgi:hypothetical protein